MQVSTPASYRCRVFRTAVAIVLVAGCSKSPTAGVPTAAELAAAEASRARAVEITEHMLQVYRNADSYADHAAYVEESVLRGEGVAHELPYYQISLALKRPNLIRLSFTEAVADAAGARQGFDVACDGEFVRATMSEIADQMVENPAPAAFTFDNVLADPLIREHMTQRSLGDVFPHLAMLIDQSDEDEDALFPLDSNPRMLTDEKLGDRPCYRVATSHPEGTRVLWIDRETYALRRMELPVEAYRQRIDPDGHYLRLSIRIDFDDVTFNPLIDSKTFVLNPPAGAHRVRRFVEPEADATATDAAASGEITAKDAKSAKEDAAHDHEHDQEPATK
jgi:outer membrane lipoprotein-sorting protein